jgi:hypothetical protein
MFQASWPPRTAEEAARLVPSLMGTGSYPEIRARMLHFVTLQPVNPTPFAYAISDMQTCPGTVTAIESSTGLRAGPSLGIEKCEHALISRVAAVQYLGSSYLVFELKNDRALYRV